MDAFTRGYVDAALWVFQLDGLGIDLPADLQAQADEDCLAFQEDNKADLDATHEAWGAAREYRHDAEQMGHDFYLTRERHGAGYWDGDYPHDVGRRLTDEAHAYGPWDEFTAWAMEQNEEEAT